MNPPAIRANSLAARDAASVLHPYTDLKANAANGSLVMTKGKGVYVYDENGKPYLETVAGLWCAALGFDNERLAKAAYEQMQKLPFYHGFTGRSHTPMIELAEMLLERSPVPMSKVFFANSGSEANDTAIKMVWYLNNALGRPQKKKIIGRIRGYHGITIAAASVTGQAANHKAFDVPLPGFHHLQCPTFYHHGQEGETEEQYASRCAEELEALIAREGADTIAAMFAEPIMGAGGVVMPPKTYFEKIQAVLNKHDILLVADEVICGFARTGNYWGSQTFDMRPDILTCAKAITSSYLPLSAVMVNQKVFDGLADQSSKIGTFGHGFTYSGHPVAAAVGVETLKIYDEIKIVDHVREVGEVMQSRLRALGDHPLVGEVRGIGLIGAIELVEDKAARRNFDPARKAGGKLVKIAEANGMIMRAMVMDSIGFSPPLIISKDEVNDMCDRVEKSLDELSVQLCGERRWHPLPEASPLAVTMGEPAGVGGEIFLKAWAALKNGAVPFFAIDDADRLAAIDPAVPIARIAEPEEALDAFGHAAPVLHAPLRQAAVPGKPETANAPAVLGSIESAVRYAMCGRAAGVVTNPIQKSALYDAGFRHPGHTEWLAELTGAHGASVMMLACPGLRVVPVTVHVSLARAIASLTTEAIVDTARITARALASDFGIARPRLAVAGLNPHAGEDSAMGLEDAEIVAPAVAMLRELGIDARGPLPPDTMFSPRARKTYDAAICMYHDQALIPLKTLDMDGGVNVTLNLPIVRTSPDHGTALDIAGRNLADPGSLIAAIWMAAEIAEARARRNA